MSERADMRSPLGRAIGLGSAKEGVAHWWAQRLTAVALIVLTLWFCASLVALVGAPRPDVVRWLGEPLPAILMLLLLIVGFYHMALGVQVVIEDYVANAWLRMAALVLNRFAAAVLAAAAIYAELRIALGV
ncbi:MAG TPA: succinate dehydrogenase, hydrophobic membrane anchor protein [Stellaceae bacterium]|nr:succinate dehydrogenase, hydrophobic membrane anchor protein [Stellaceae bacterium]